MKQVITSLLDNDFYKFSMLNAVLKTYPGEEVEYTFHNRDKRDFSLKVCSEICEQIRLMANIKLTQIEELFLRKEFSLVFDEDFFEFIKNFKFDPSTVTLSGFGADLTINIKGTWEQTILWEVPLMAIISEVYFGINNPTTSLSDFKIRTAKKGKTISEKDYHVIEFGTRRRFSKLTQSLAISILKMNWGIRGTSNMYFGMIHNLPIKGTTAHEWIMFHGAKYGYENANNRAMEAWKSVYGKKLNVVLTDTYTSQHYFDHLDPTEAKALDGFRQDSGDPLIYTDLVLKYLKDNNITKAKSIMYSDSLSLDKIDKIDGHRPAATIIRTYGVGTYFTNDIEGIKPLNMVIKLSKVGDKPTVKISDDLGKNTGDSEEIINCKKELKL